MPTKFVVLPKSHPSDQKWLQLSDRYKAFRLLSLRLSPESFASTYAREVAFPPEEWTSRLSNPQATTVVAVDADLSDPATDDFDLALEAEWEASLVIVGPLDRRTLAVYLHLEDSSTELGPAHSSKGARRQYALNGMYVVPSARGRKLGVQILEHAKRFVAAEAKASGEKARLSLVVDYDNPPARRTYENAGFEVVHRYWFDDYREGREARTEGAVMMLDLDDDSVGDVTESK